MNRFSPRGVADDSPRSAEEFARVGFFVLLGPLAAQPARAEVITSTPSFIMGQYSLNPASLSSSLPVTFQLVTGSVISPSDLFGDPVNDFNTSISSPGPVSSKTVGPTTTSFLTSEVSLGSNTTGLDLSLL